MEKTGSDTQWVDVVEVFSTALTPPPLLTHHLQLSNDSGAQGDVI